MATKDGQKTGGRQKGVPNKKTQIIESILEELNCDPIKILAAVANGEPLKARIGVGELSKKAPGCEDGDDDFVEGDVIPTLDQRISAAKELCQYVYPKRKAIEHSGPQGGPVAVTSINVLPVKPAV